MEYLAVLIVVSTAFVISAWGVDVVASVPSLPIQTWAKTAINWLNANLEGLFDTIAAGISIMLGGFEFIFVMLPATFVATLITGVAYLSGGWRVALFVLLAQVFVASMGFFDPMMVTLSLVATATSVALILGIPLGILKAHSLAATQILDPILDFMQTMPLFVYLIPVVLFFSIGNIPGIIATFIFAMPPAVRLTALGIEQIPHGLLEAGHAFGATPSQFLTKVELPLALPSIMAGVNQTIMLALSMVVIASMVGAEGLGLEVYNAITRLKVGQGIASGIGIVLLAMILDRITRAAGKRS